MFWQELPPAFHNLRQWRAHGRRRTYLIVYATDEPQHGYVWSRKRGDAPAVLSREHYETLDAAKDACLRFEGSPGV